MDLQEGDLAVVNSPASLWVYNGANWLPVNNLPSDGRNGQFLVMDDSFPLKTKWQDIPLPVHH